MALELSNKVWKVVFGDGASRRTVACAWRDELRADGSRNVCWGRFPPIRAGALSGHYRSYADYCVTLLPAFHSITRSARGRIDR